MDPVRIHRVFFTVLLSLLCGWAQSADQLMLLNPYLPDAYLTLRSTNKEDVDTIKVTEGGDSYDLAGVEFNINTLTTGAKFGKTDYKLGSFNAGIHLQVDQFGLSKSLAIRNEYFYTLLFPLKWTVSYKRFEQQIQLIPGLKTNGKYISVDDADLDIYYVGQYRSTEKRRWVFGLATYGEMDEKKVIPIAGIHLLPGNGRSFYLTYPRVLMLWRINPKSYGGIAGGLSEERWNDNVNGSDNAADNLSEKEIFLEGRYGFNAGGKLWMKVFVGISAEREFEFTNENEDELTITPSPALYMGVSAQYRPFIGKLTGL